MAEVGETNRARRKTLNRDTHSSFTLIRQSKANVDLIQKQIEAQEWIQTVLDTRFPEDTDFPGAIEDGVLLCRLVLAIKPNCIKKINPTKARFKMMENISQFVQVCKDLGVPEATLFTATDLTDRANMIRVVNCIHALADVAGRQGFQPKMDRLFSDEVTMLNTRANFANVKETDSMRDAVTKLNYEKRVSIATVFADSMEDLKPSKIEASVSINEIVDSIPMTPEPTREHTESSTEEESPRDRAESTASTATDITPASSTSDEPKPVETPTIESPREPTPSLDLGIPDVMDDILVNKSQPEKKEKKKKKEKKEKKSKTLERPHSLTPEEEEKRKEERRKRHKEKKERNTLPPNLEFYEQENNVTAAISASSEEAAPATGETTDDPNIRSWKKKAGTMSYSSSIKLVDKRNSKGPEEEQQQQQPEKPASPTTSGDSTRIRSWKSKGNSIHQEDIERYYATHGASADEESALSDSLKVRSWKERTKNTGYNSLNAIQKYYVNLKANDQDKVSIEEKIKENKENMIKRVEMREAADTKTNEEAEEEKRERMRIEVLTEILLSERYFVRDLETIVFVFLKPLKNLEILTNEELESLVSNVELILKVNKLILNSLLKDFDESGNIQLINVGQAFYKQIDYLKIYGVYASNHSNAVKSYENFKKKYKKFAEFMKEKEALPDCQKINFLGFLIKPVQRLTKYHLLFRELLKHTPKDHPDYENIEKCFTKVQEVASYVNERQRTSESIQKMVEIQENMINTDKGFSVYSTDRVFVREGPVTIVESEGEKPQELHYFLFNDMFLYCKTQLAKKATFKYRGQVDLGKSLVGELHPENDLSFQIMRLDAKKTMIVTLPNATEKKSLFNEMAKLVDSLMQNGGSLKSRSSLPLTSEGSSRNSLNSPKLASIKGALSFNKSTS